MKKSKGKIFLFGGFLVVGLIYISYLLAFNDYSNKETKVKNIVNNGMAIYLQGEDGNYKFSKELSKKEDGLVLDEKKSMCDGNTKVSWNYEDWRLILKDIDRDGMRCYLYFREPMTIDNILASKNIDVRTDFSTILESDTTGTIFKAEDNDGETYYFAGSPKDNWVKFAGFYWRIIRINGDGTLRLIYSGNEESGPVTEGEETQIGTSAFNVNYDDNAYVGYMYGTPGSDTYEKTHENITDSTLKEILDKWYTNNIGNNKIFTSKIDINAGFCGDRSLTTEGGEPNETGGFGLINTYYGIFYRLYFNKILTFKCSKGNTSSDLYTKIDADKGNKALIQPVGLITADEASYAGGRNGDYNTSYYLNTKENFWTMTPTSFNANYGAYVASVSYDGYISIGAIDSLSHNIKAIRPVINLRADTKFTGTGFSNDLFAVVGAS